MKFPGEFIEKVREANNVLDVIGAHVQLTRAGSSYRGLCPFPGHAERTPSFFVSDVKQVYHCFGCQKSGNVFTFLMDFQGLTFPDAVSQLAERANIPLPEIKDIKDAYKKDDESKIYFKINKYVAAYWAKNLNSKPADHPVKRYIAKRGLNQETLTEFQIGYSEESWQNLTDMLTRAKAPLQQTERLTLIKKRNDGKYFDIFRNRLMFPIISTSGNVVGFGGRSIDDNQQPKYLNSSESPVFNKSRTLYGIHATAKYVRAEQELILVEGYMDMLALYQAGIKNVAATLGTAFTAEHVRAIQKLSNKVVVLFDGDEAGQTAADRSLPFFLEAGVLSRCVALKDAKDPDEFISKFGAEEFKRLVNQAPDHFTAFLNRKLQGFKGRSSEKKEILDSVKPLMDRVKDQQLRSLYLQEVADRLNIDTNELARAKPQYRVQPLDSINEIRKPVLLDKPSKDEKLLVQFVLVEKEYLERVRDSGVIESFLSPGAKKLAERIVEKYCQNPSDFDKLAASVMRENTTEVEILKGALSIFGETRIKDREEEKRMLEDCIAKVRERNLRLRSKEILNTIKTESNESVLMDFMKVMKEQKGPKKEIT